MVWEIFILATTVLFLLNWWGHSYWKRRNVFSIPTKFFFGNVKEMMLQRKTMPVQFDEIYKKHKNQRVIGFYSFYSPMLFITDPEIIKKVLATDFNSFADNGFVLDKTVDPLFGKNPFTIKGIPEWKELRGIQAGLQTALKLKEYLPGIVTVANSMTTYIQEQKGQPILTIITGCICVVFGERFEDDANISKALAEDNTDAASNDGILRKIKDLATRLTVGAAVLTAYGIEPNSFTDPEFTFLKHATDDKIFNASDMSSYVPFFFPLLSKLLSLRIFSKEAQDFFMSMVKMNIEHRQSFNINRGDLIDTIIKLNKKRLEQNNRAYTLIEMAAHCTTFYMDATVTITEVLCFLMQELANHLNVQEELRQEILSVGKNLEDFDYDKIHSLAYLQMVLDESMRLHAPVSTLSRICTKDIMIDDINIAKGTKVFISPYALHHDPEYYPEPKQFKPERFSEENKLAMVKYTFLPFGEGPRICVGMKYATLVVKLTIASILLKYRILSTNDQQEIKHNPGGAFIITSPPDISLKFEKL